MKQLVSKLNAGALALLMLVAAAIAPASTALAYVPPIAGEGTGNNTKAYCQLTGNGYKIHTDNSSDGETPAPSALTYLFDYQGSKQSLEAKIIAKYSNVQDFCDQAIQEKSTYEVSPIACQLGSTNSGISIIIKNTKDVSNLNVTYTIELSNANRVVDSFTTSPVKDGEQFTTDYLQQLTPGSYTVKITANDDGTPVSTTTIEVTECDMPDPAVPAVIKVPVYSQMQICGPASNDTITFADYDETAISVSDESEWEDGQKTYTFTITDPAKHIFGEPNQTNVTLNANKTVATVVVRDVAQQCQTVPILPDMPLAGECNIALYGRTIRSVDTNADTERPKYGEGGEINADTWGNTYRLYAAADKDLVNVSLTWKATQGMTFNQNSVNTVVSPGAGALQQNGYTQAAIYTGSPVISDDGKTVTFFVESMPAKSSISFNVSFTPDGSYDKLVVDGAMTGDLTVCPAPAPKFDDMTCEVNDEVWYQIPAHDENTYYTFQSGNGNEVKVAAGKHALLRINQNVVIRAYTVNAHGQWIQSGEWKHDFTIPTCTPGMGGEKPVTPILPAPVKPAVAVQELPQTGAADTPNLLWTGLGVAVAVYGATYFAQRKQEN